MYFLISVSDDGAYSLSAIMTLSCRVDRYFLILAVGVDGRHPLSLSLELSGLIMISRLIVGCVPFTGSTISVDGPNGLRDSSKSMSVSACRSIVL